MTEQKILQEQKIIEAFKELKAAWPQTKGYVPIKVYKDTICKVMFGHYMTCRTYHWRGHDKIWSDTNITKPSEVTKIEKIYNAMVTQKMLKLSKSGEFALFIER